MASGLEGRPPPRPAAAAAALPSAAAAAGCCCRRRLPLTVLTSCGSRAVPSAAQDKEDTLIRLRVCEQVISELEGRLKNAQGECEDLSVQLFSARTELEREKSKGRAAAAERDEARKALRSLEVQLKQTTRRCSSCSGSTVSASLP